MYLRVHVAFPFLLSLYLQMEELLYKDKELFRGIADGDEVAFTQIFHEYNARLFPFVCKISKSEMVAEEIVQEVFLRLWVNREEVAQMEHPVGWLYRVASNLSISYLRQLAGHEKKLKQLGGIQETSANNVTDSLGAKEIQELINKAIAQLPPRRQQIYQLSRQTGLSHKEIAGKLGLSTNTVKDQLVISLKFIKGYIRKETGISISILVMLFNR